MAYDLELSERLEELLKSKRGFVQKKMFGGICWLFHGNMCVGVYKDWLIVRVGEQHGSTLFREKYVKPMDITGKVMKGWGMVAPKGYAAEGDLTRYVGLAATFVKTLPRKS